MKVRQLILVILTLATITGCGITSLHGSGEVDIETDGHTDQKEDRKDETV
jgi:hypothetical protein